MTADLHIHTTASDGRLSPQEIWNQARKANLKYISITDHDTTEGLSWFKKHPQSDLTVIPGIELNTDLPEYEVHILGYGIDLSNNRLTNELKKIAWDRVVRARKIVDKLNFLGFPIDYNRVMEIAGNSRSIGRPHVAKALIEQGYFLSIDEIFSTLLDKNGPAYIPHYKLTPEDAMQLIVDAGGIPVLAHPGLIGSEDVVLKLIHQGLLGLEAFHPKHTDEQTERYTVLAQKYGLLITGGSDYHGITGRFPEELGQFTIPASLAEKLMRKARH